MTSRPTACVLCFTACLIGFARPARSQIELINVGLTDDVVVPSGQTATVGETVYLNGFEIEAFGTVLPQRAPEPIVLANAGQIVLRSEGAGWVEERVGGPRSTVTVTHSVQVLGEKGTTFFSTNVSNRGVFAAIDSPGAGAFVIEPFLFYNYGVLEARSGGRLEVLDADRVVHREDAVVRAHPGGEVWLRFDPITSLEDIGPIENLGGLVTLEGQIDNTGRTLDLSGGDWELVAATVTGGVLNTPATPLELRSSRLRDVTVNGDLQTTFGQKAILEGTLTLNGEFRNGWEIEAGGPVVVDGTGVVSVFERNAWIDSRDGIDFGSDVTLRAQNGSQLRLLYGEYESRGGVDADGGVVSIGLGGTLNNHGSMVARNGGAIQFADRSWEYDATTLTNNLPGAEIRAEAGGRVHFVGRLHNEGSLVIDGGAAHVVDYDVAGGGTVSITDSLILSAGTTLTELMSVPRGAGSEYGTASGVLDLEGGVLTLADAEGQRFTLRGGEVRNGVVEALDAQPLVATTSLLGEPTDSSLRDLRLEAGLRVLPGATVAIEENVIGEGRFTVAGGRLELGRRVGEFDVRDLVERTDPISGQVVIRGALENVGRTTVLPAAVDWRMSHVRSSGIAGGRVEGEPGATLTVEEGYGGNTIYGTFGQGVTLALPLLVDNTRAYVNEGLTLDEAPVTVGVPNGDIDDPFADARLVFVGPQALSGVGEVRFNRIDGFNGAVPYPRINMLEIADDRETGSGLTIEPGITVRTWAGDGYVGGNYFYQVDPAPAPLTNHGRFVAENGHTLTMFTSDFEQRGTLRSEAASLLRVVDTDVLNEGRLETAGGAIAFTGDLSLASESVVSVELSLDQLAGTGTAIEVGGAATLGGLLAITSPDERWIPQTGDVFSVLSADGGVSGAFSAQSLPPLTDGLYWDVDVGANEMTLAVLTGAPTGDFNSDGVVDAADYTLVRDRMGESFDLPNEDATPGVVTEEDLATWRANFGSVANPAAAVPEPSAYALLVGMVILSRRRR